MSIQPIEPQPSQWLAEKIDQLFSTPAPSTKYYIVNINNYWEILNRSPITWADACSRKARIEREDNSPNHSDSNGYIIIHEHQIESVRRYGDGLRTAHTTIPNQPDPPPRHTFPA